MIHIKIGSFLEGELRHSGTSESAEIHEQIVYHYTQAVQSSLPSEVIDKIHEKLEAYINLLHPSRNPTSTFEVKWPGVIISEEKKVGWDKVFIPKSQKNEIMEMARFPLKMWKQQPQGKTNFILHGVTGVGEMPDNTGIFLRFIDEF